MIHTVEKWLRGELHRDPAPEFRAAHDMFDKAYSGPEQRRRVKHRLGKDRRRVAGAAAAKQRDSALAA